MKIIVWQFRLLPIQPKKSWYFRFHLFIPIATMDFLDLGTYLISQYRIPGFLQLSLNLFLR
jgi:hypothetical protein